jgi:hypothetical protein
VNIAALLLATLALAGAVAGLLVMIRLMKPLFVLPNLLDDSDMSPERRDAVGRAERAVRRGMRLVQWPVIAITLLTVVISAHAGSRWASIVVLAPGLSIALVWQTVGMRRWWKWAIQQDADMLLVEELAEEARMISPRTSWFGRRARRTWMRLPEPQDKPPQIDADPTYY